MAPWRRFSPTRIDQRSCHHRWLFAAPDRMAVVVPPGLDGGDTPVKVAFLPGATLVRARWHPPRHRPSSRDYPVFGGDGNLYVTYSGSRGQEATVSILKVTADGARNLSCTVW